MSEPISNKDVLIELRVLAEHTERLRNVPLPAAFTAAARAEYDATNKRRLAVLRSVIELYEALEAGRAAIVIARHS